MADQNIIARVKKLLALSNNNPSVHEAAAALARAQQIMTEHRITQAMLDEVIRDTTADDILERPVYRGKGYKTGKKTKIHQWKIRLASAIAEVNGCTIFYVFAKEIRAVGCKSDLDIVEYLVDYVLNQIEQLSKVASKMKRDTVYGWNRSRGRIYAHQFKQGAVDTVKKRLREAVENAKKAQYEKALADKDSYNLIRLDSAIQMLSRRFELAKNIMNTNHNLRTVTRRHQRDNTGRKDGRRAGHHVDLDKRKRKKLS